MSKRKAFNFYHSYYDVVKELPKEQQLDFLMSLLERQFHGTEPKLKGMAKIAYVAIKHSVDSQVSGYENKTGTKLGGSVGGGEGGSVQEKEKEKEEVELTSNFLRKNSEWKNQLLKHYNINTEEYNRHLGAFELANDMTRPELELKKHFFNYLKHQDLKTIKKVINSFDEIEKPFKGS